MSLRIVSAGLLEYYRKNQPITLLKHFSKLKNKPGANAGLDFYNTISAVYSSLIEGSKLDLDDYLKIADSGMNRTNKDFMQVNDLKKAYEFAQKSAISTATLLEIHALATSSLISEKKYSGNYRDKGVGVYKEGIKIYQGCGPAKVNEAMDMLMDDIAVLLNATLSIDEVFYFAAMIHLVFVKIHPFADGNGRTARLLEKWFVASAIGMEAWKIQSEKLYQTHLKAYYDGLDIGKEYDSVDYDLAFPFLKMLPMALRVK